MTRIVTMMSVLALTLFPVSLMAQSQGDYRTRDSGDWSNAQIWEQYNGSAWVATGNPPTGSETITVLGEDSVYVDVAVSISDTVINQGIVEANVNLTFAAGGVYQHDQDAGKVPLSTWEEGSTLYMTGVVAEAPEDRNQDYYNMTFNTPGLLSNLNMDLDEATISGDIRVIDTGLARWYLTSVLPQDTATVTIMGDVIVENGTFSVQGTSNAETTFIVDHFGNIDVTGGNFSISRGSQPNGTTTWYIHEGDFSMSNATTQSSTVTPAGAKFVFTRQGTQTLTLGEGNELTAFPIQVDSLTTLDMGESRLGGSGVFIVNQGATVTTALAGGLAELVADVVATVTLEDGSSYGFTGTDAQVTSEVMPTTVTDLIIDNEAGVTLTQETTINGTLRLLAGVFDNTVPFTLGPNGDISFEGGDLLIPVSVETRDETIPETFFVDQNYPNPFNPSTTIRFGLPVASHVTAKIFNVLGQEVVTIFDGRKGAGEHALQFDASNLSSGVYMYQIQTGDAVVIKRMVLAK